MANPNMPLSLATQRPPALVSRRRPELAPAPSSLQPFAAAESYSFLGMQFSPSIPSLPSPRKFGFLKSVDLSTVGLSISDIPCDFGWPIVKYCPSTEESRAVSGNNLEMHDVELDCSGKVGTDCDQQGPQTGSVSNRPADLDLPDFDLNSPQPGSETVRESVGFDHDFWVSDVSDTEGATNQTSPDSMALDIPFNPTPIAISPPSPATSPVKPKNRPSVKSTNKPSVKPSQKTPAKTTTQPTRQSSRLASRTLPRSANRPSKPITLSDSSSDTESIREEYGIPDLPHTSTDSDSSSLPSPPKTGPNRKRKATPKEQPSHGPPASKKPRPGRFTTPLLSKFLQRSVVKGKLFKVEYFQNQGLDEFVQKLQAQGWLELFTNETLGCSTPDLAEFYANCSVKNGVVTSSVGGQKISFDAINLGKILGVPTDGCTDYVREDKSVLTAAQSLDICRRLSQNPSLSVPRSVKKSEMAPMHQLLFWFIIKGVIPRGQGRNLADLMDQHLVDLLDRGVPISLPDIMIRHIHRIATSTRDHDMGYGFFLTLVLENLGVSLERRIGVQHVDMIGPTTLHSCGFSSKTVGASSAQSSQPQLHPVPGSSLQSTSEDLLPTLERQQAELAQVKAELAEERALNAKRHDDLLSLLASMNSKLAPSSSSPP